MAATIFKNAKVITPLSITPGEVLVVDDKIAEISLLRPGESKVRPIDMGGARIIDCEGLYLSPGFVETHCHGGGGYDFMDGDLESIYGAVHTHLLHGTTSILPTTLTSTREAMMDTIDLFNQLDLEQTGNATILGLHMEGPYFAANQAGAQDPRYLRHPEPQEYEAAFKRSDRIKRWSFAIELPGGEAFLNRLNQEGIVSSVAHSDATLEDVRRAYENGLTCLTHFYSAMSTVVRKNAYRIAGVVEAGYLIDDLVVEVIADGRHLPADLLQLIYKVIGADHIVLVTDSMRGAGLPEGEIIKLGSKEDGMDAIIEDGVAKLMDRSAFAGSVATADRLVRTFRDLTGAPLYEVVRMMSLNPAKLLHVADRKGSIAVAKDADLLIFDDRIQIKTVMARGVIIDL